MVPAERAAGVSRPDEPVGDPALWSGIERALTASRFFILLASPGAAASGWVDKEVSYWREHKPMENFLIALTEGDIAWDNGVGDLEWEQTTALPRSLEGAFAAEPLWVDLRFARGQSDVSLRQPGFRNAIADLAAPIHGRDKDTLLGDDITEHRRTMRLARGGVAILAALALAASVSAFLALQQRNTARTQRDAATSRGLAAQTLEQLDTRPDRSLLLGLEAVRLDPRSAEARSALASALERTEHTQMLRGHDGEAIASTPDGRVIAVGRRDGTVTVRWSGEEARVATFRACNGCVVLALTMSQNASRLAADVAAGPPGADSVRVWDISTPKPRPISRAIPAVTSWLAFDPSGTQLAFTSSRGHELTLWDVARKRLVPLGKPAVFGAPSSFAFRSDGAALASQTSDEIVVWDIRTQRVIGRAKDESIISRLAFGPRGQLATFSVDGRVAVWRVRRNHLKRIATFETGQETGNLNTVGLGWFSPSEVIVATATSGAKVWTLGQSPRGRVALAPTETRHFTVLTVTPRSRVLAGVGLGAMEAWNLAPAGAFVRAYYSSKAAALPLWLRRLTHQADLRLTQLADAEGPDWWVRSPNDATLELQVNRKGGATLWRSSAQEKRGLWDDQDAFLGSFQPGGKLIAFGERNPSNIDLPAPHSIVFRDAETGRRGGEDIVVTSDSNSKIVNLVFTPDGSLLVSGTECTSCHGRATTRLWDVRERIAIGQPLPGLPLGFSPDGTRLALRHESGNIVVIDDTPWTTEVNRLRRRVCGLVARNLTRDEWRSFAGGGKVRRTCG